MHKFINMHIYDGSDSACCYSFDWQYPQVLSTDNAGIVSTLSHHVTLNERIRIHVLSTLVASRTEGYGQLDVINLMHIGLDQTWHHQMLARLFSHQGQTSSFHLFGRLCQHRCTSNHTLHSSLNLLWLYNGCCLQFKCICSWHILTA